MERLSCRIAPIPAQKLHYPGPRQSCPVVYFNISYELHSHGIFVSSDGTQTLVGEFIHEPVTSSFWSDIDLFKNKQLVYNNLSPKLSGLGIHSRHHERLVSKIIESVTKIAYWVSKKRKVLPILMEVERSRRVLSFERRRDQAMMDRALRESRLELEERNYGMVPTARKSRLLKCVKVEMGCDTEEQDESEERKRRRTSEICTICLEELPEFSASMPCGHLFHGNCIISWLEKSHYCPVCRFEMPTETIKSECF